MSRALQLLTRGSSQLQRSAQGGVTFVRNAGAVSHGPQLPPFPPGPRQMEQAKNWYSLFFIFLQTKLIQVNLMKSVATLLRVLYLKAWIVDSLWCDGIHGSLLL